MVEHIGAVRTLEESGGHFVAWSRDEEERWILHNDDAGPVRGEEKFRHPRQKMSLNTFMAGIILLAFVRIN